MTTYVVNGASGGTITASQISDSTATGRSLITAASATAAAAAVGITSGLDAARPAASTAGRIYDATDTGARYLDTGSAWRVSSAGGGPDLVTAEGWSDTAYLSGGVGTAVGPVGGPGWTYIACVYVTTLPGSLKVYATYSGAAAGWTLGIGQNTANCLSLGHVQSGPTNQIVQSGVVTTGWHKFAVAMAANGLSAQWSLDGSAASTTSITLSSYVTPDAAALLAFGRFNNSYAGYSQSDLGVAGVVLINAVMSGADLATVTGTPSNGRILTPAGYTEDFAYRAALAVQSSAGIICTGATPRTLVNVGTPRAKAR